MNFELLIKKGLEAGITDIEVYSEKSKGLSLSIFQGEMDKSELSDTFGFSVRGIYNDKMAYYTSENPHEDIDLIIENLKQNADALTTEEEFEIFGGSKEYKRVEKEYSNFHAISPQKKLEMLRDLEMKVKESDPRIVHVPYCSYSEVESTVQIVNSKGVALENTNKYAILLVGAVASENGDQKSSYELQAVNKFEDFDVDKLAADAVHGCLSLLGAEPVPSKAYPVIFQNKVMASILSAFQSVFSGEAALRKMTLLLGKENEEVMSKKITIEDNPFHKEALLNKPFDDEGVACYQKDIISQGVFKGFMHNLKTAKHFKTTSTGNGFKAGLGGTTGVGGTNLILQPGTTSFDELISSTEEGLYITDVAGLHSGLDPVSGNFSVQASGYLITEGKIAKPVTLIVISGNFFKMMSEVDTVGSDLYVGYNGVGAPAIKFESLNVSGK